MFERWSAQGVGFVTRLKANANCQITEEHPLPPKSANPGRDESIEFQVFQAGRTIKGNIPADQKSGSRTKQEELVLVTNLHHLGATTSCRNLQAALAN